MDEPDKQIEHEIITIENHIKRHSIDVFLAYSISPVVKCTIINISEEHFIIEHFGTNNLKWESYNEHVLAVKDNSNVDEDRIGKLAKLIRTEYLNAEERNSIVDLCSNFQISFSWKGIY